MDWFKMFYAVLGGLGLFFFGMKILSESLQASASDFIRNIIGKLTNNRLVAVGVGLIVTCLIQSSSITTVMVVGFVNAGLMNLMQALGVILGANIGTTITGWMISIKVGQYSLLFIGLGALPHLLAKNSKVKVFGKLIFAIGLIFLGLDAMSGAFKPLRTEPSFINLMTYFTADNYFSLLATITAGCLLTFVIQSSSAMLGITIALATSGSITFQTALALVMGENIGTTITALLASVGTNTSARRAGLGHAIFNVLGVFILTLLFIPYRHLIEAIIPGDAFFIAADGTAPHVAPHIAAGHTLFNVINTLIFIPLLPLLHKTVCWIVPEEKQKEERHLDFVGDLSTLSPALGIHQAYLEVVKQGQLVADAVSWTKSLLEDPYKNKDLIPRIRKYETISDNIQKEITIFLGRVMEASLTKEETKGVQSILRMADELESVADYCESITYYLERLERHGLRFDGETHQEVNQLATDVKSLFDAIFENVKNHSEFDFKKFDEIREGINQYADQLKWHHIQRIHDHKIPALASVTLSDIAVALRRMKNHTVNLAESYLGGKAHLSKAIDTDQ
ncbi:MAG: Na/Pi cotransporter family protein [Bdellovibrionales bacterium]|nr:Na/Pi cotransporter family protein [Bdellovibrionales bacterium]